MKKIGFFFFLFCSLTVSLISLLFLPPPFDLWLGLTFGIIPVAVLFFPRSKKNVKIRIAGFTWSLNDFCRGWLITGQTGSGKTACAIRNILHALFSDVPDPPQTPHRFCRNRYCFPFLRSCILHLLPYGKRKNTESRMRTCIPHGRHPPRPQRTGIRN